MLPEHLLQYLQEHISCRETQIKQLAGIFDTQIPSPPVLVAHGSRATGKSLTIAEVLRALGIPHAIIRSRECITGRHLLERTILACKLEVEKTGETVFNDIDGRCESLSSLAVILQRLLEHTQKFVLVFDGIDKQREAPPTLLPALSRLGELIPHLTSLLISNYPHPGSFSKSGIPHIFFPPYSRAEALDIVAKDAPSIFSQSQIDAMDSRRRLETEEDDPWLWGRFTGAVWDTLGKATARDVVTLRSVCEKLWLPFVSHIRDGTYGTRDFSRLMVRTRALFQSESVLVGSLITPLPPSSASTSISVTDTPNPFNHDSTKPRKQQSTGIELSYFTRFLLLAAYLASHNPARTDQTFFSKTSERKKRKKRSGPGGGVARRPQKRRKLSRRLLGPQPFGLERWLAIFHAIVPDGAPGGSADVLTQIATLGALRMVVRSGGALGNPADTLGEGSRWRVNIGWEFVSVVAKGLKFEIADCLVE